MTTTPTIPSDNILRFTQEQYDFLRAHPNPWWDWRLRNALGRIGPGEPGMEGESDEDGNFTPSGIRVMSMYGTDKWDWAIAFVSLAGVDFAMSLGEDGAVLAYTEAIRVRDAMIVNMDALSEGTLTMVELEDIIKAEVRRQATALEVDISFVDAEPEMFEPGLVDPTPEPEPTPEPAPEPDPEVVTP